MFFIFEIFYLDNSNETSYKILFKKIILTMNKKVVEVAWEKSEFPELHFSVSQKQASTSTPLTFS